MGAQARRSRGVPVREGPRAPIVRTGPARCSLSRAARRVPGSVRRSVRRAAQRPGRARPRARPAAGRTRHPTRRWSWPGPRRSRRGRYGPSPRWRRDPSSRGCGSRLAHRSRRPRHRSTSGGGRRLPTSSRRELLLSSPGLAFRGSPTHWTAVRHNMPLNGTTKCVAYHLRCQGLMYSLAATFGVGRPSAHADRVPLDESVCPLTDRPGSSVSTDDGTEGAGASSTMRRSVVAKVGDRRC